ncbi:MAG: ketol-acid reductoisomerase [Candidatus Bathyarchaeia archaeon]
MEVFYDKDVNTNVLKEKTIAVIGYGIQGRAQALNLRDSGYNVILGLRSEGASQEIAEKEGFLVYTVEEACKRADVILILIPDMPQSEVYESQIRPYVSEGKALAFSHGFSVHFKQIVPPKNVDVFMVAPKAPGKRMRELYMENFGTPALLAVFQNYTGNAEKMGLEMSKGLGCTKAGVIKTSFKDEAESDIIGEQTVLVGGLMELIKTAFDVLVEEGYPPELAYFEACNEAKLIVDLIYEKGITGMLNGVSLTARYGGLAIGPKVIDQHVKENMHKAARDVKSGNFAQQWIDEYKKGSPNFKRMMNEVENSEIERVGKLVRKMSGLEK